MIFDPNRVITCGSGRTFPMPPLMNPVTELPSVDHTVQERQYQTITTSITKERQEPQYFTDDGFIPADDSPTPIRRTAPENRFAPPTFMFSQESGPPSDVPPPPVISSTYDGEGLPRAPPPPMNGPLTGSPRALPPVSGSSPRAPLPPANGPPTGSPTRALPPVSGSSPRTPVDPSPPVSVPPSSPSYTPPPPPSSAPPTTLGSGSPSYTPPPPPTTSNRPELSDRPMSMFVNQGFDEDDFTLDKPVNADKMGTVKIKPSRSNRKSLMRFNSFKKFGRERR
eukprot:TRINITY_DN1573_c0_g1_i2.p1 TRINITY_DN1573_c0_g1~~TRINITY_DN1573_c0_g1_i2.p1  ORF type:complete len:294 (+),score=71.46 TRINITY_DN1573_c0_g1_i2:40-882(+)